jgi:hypothetical protein
VRLSDDRVPEGSGKDLDPITVLQRWIGCARQAEFECAVSNIRSAVNPVPSNRGEEELGDVSMNLGWLAAGIGIVAVLAKWAAWFDRRGTAPALGFVSHQWLAEHRLSQISDPHR